MDIPHRDFNIGNIIPSSCDQPQDDLITGIVLLKFHRKMTIIIRKGAVSVVFHVDQFFMFCPYFVDEKDPANLQII